MVRGRAEFNGQGFVDVGKGSLTIAGQTSEAAPSFDPNKREPVFDLTETSLDFELFVERAGSQIIASGAPARRGCGLPPEVVEEIVKRTDGVPLFLEEVTKVVPETALTNTAGGAIAVLPSSIGGAPDLQASLMARLDRRVAGHPLSALLSHRVSRLRARTVCPIGDLAGGSEPAELGVSAEAAEGHRRGRLWIDLTPSLRARRMAENGASRSLPCVPGEGLLIERRNGRSASAARTSLYVESPSVSALTTIAVG